MKDVNQLSNINCSLQDVGSAWLVAAAAIFGLLGISLIQEIPKSGKTVDWVSEDNSARTIDVLVDEFDFQNKGPGPNVSWKSEVPEITTRRFAKLAGSL